MLTVVFLKIIPQLDATVAPRESLWAHVVCAAPSPASRHDAGDPGAADRRRAHRWSRHHVFHQAACTSASAHLCFPSSLPTIDFSSINTFY